MNQRIVPWPVAVRSVAVLPVVPLLLVLLAAPAAADGPDPCAHLDPASLPHTADSAQAWFDSCRPHHDLPRTADGAAAWLG